ncbi:MAG: CD225/dispanin family protein [Muribaculaceae bacterium]|nr:CD225/dispanin family protein [Muribaculaceae bacterium]MDE5858599.1 CD225/dispanin family protein [Muribaculaceae bacterium]
MKYYIARDKKPVGPLELDELRHYSIGADTLIWTPGNTDWKEARNFPEVMAVVSENVTPPPFSASKLSRTIADTEVYGTCAMSDEYGPDGRYQPLRPNNYLAEAIVLTILCCNILGVISIIYALKVNKLYDERHFEEARRASINARNWFFVTLVSGVMSWIIFFFHVKI